MLVHHQSMIVVVYTMLPTTFLEFLISEFGFEFKASRLILIIPSYHIFEDC